ncbi:MAG: hypothetical protein HY534_02080 [Chloroflexi bacterium]|nr:hypothetical protein [Chloroflexota bacterium]
MALKERDFFKQPLTEDELRGLLGPRAPSEIFNWRSVTARKLGLSSQQGKLAEDDLLRLMVQEPGLIKRPLIVVGDELVAGFDKAARLSQLLRRPL